MNDSVQRYRERRQARLDAKAVEEYHRRRDERLNSRFDDDEDGNNAHAKRSGGHGNTKIPYGLCQREGIPVDPKWSPSDAWAALEKKGYSAGSVYKELKETGKVARKGTAKRPPTKIEESHLPEFLKTKALKKSTMEIVGFVNDHCDDGNITEFLGMGVGAGRKEPQTVVCKRSGRDASSKLVVQKSLATDLPTKAELTIPMMPDSLSEEERSQAIRTFCHEYTHYLDMVGREGDKHGHFCDSYKPLSDAIKADDGSVGEEARKLFSEYESEYKRISEEYRRKFNAAPLEVMREKYGDHVPEFIHERTGLPDMYTAMKMGRYAEAKRYASEVKKRSREIIEEGERRRRSAREGITSLQGVYDSISGGKLRDSKMVRYGHSLDYFRKHEPNRSIEALADWVALKATNSKLAEVFYRDKPRIARALDDTVVALTKKLRGEP